MERRLGQVLDLQLVEAYLKLDSDQLSSRKVASQFTKVIKNFGCLLITGEGVCESKPFQFGCSVARFCSVCIDNRIFDIYLIATHVHKCHPTSPSEWIEDGR